MHEIIEKILADKIQNGEEVQSPAGDILVETAAAQVKKAFGAELPQDYAKFWSVTNGLDYNGVVLYGAGQTVEMPGPGGFWQGILEANTNWREGPGHTEYLVLGETDMDLLTVDLAGRDPVLRDKVSSDVFEQYETVAAAVDSILNERF